MASDLMGLVRKRWRYYVIFRKAVFHIWGLIFVHSWVESAVVALLITHLTGILDVPKAASVVNLLDGTTAVLMLINAYFSETYLGPFLALVCTTITYISGLLLLLFYLGEESHGETAKRLVYVIVILIGSGRAGRDTQLKEFLGDQCRTEAPDEDEEQVESRRKIWWRSAYILGVIASVYLFTKDSWKSLRKISVISMGVAFVGFLLGFPFYERKKPAKTTLHDLLLHLFTNRSCKLRLHHIRTSRSVKEWKSLLRMLPLWSMFLVYSLLLATANTFFYLQTDYTANYLGRISVFSDEQSNYWCNGDKLHIRNEVPVIIFVVIRYATSFVVSRLCDLLLSLHWGENIPRRVMVVRSGVGLAVSPACCAVAWRIEEYRVRQRMKHGICLRFSWLMPQFVLLGLMEGLVFEGMQSIYESVAPPSLKKYAPTFTFFALNIGHFTSLLFVFIFRHLFNDDLDFSRLGVYYRNLGFICLANLVIYCCVATFYVKQEADEEEEEDNIEQPLELIQIQKFVKQTALCLMIK